MEGLSNIIPWRSPQVPKGPFSSAMFIGFLLLLSLVGCCWFDLIIVVGLFSLTLYYRSVTTLEVSGVSYNVSALSPLNSYQVRCVVVILEFVARCFGISYLSCFVVSVVVGM